MRTDDLKGAPLYQQVTHALRKEIGARQYALGTFLPSIRSMAAHFHCSLTTVQLAIRALTQEGLLASDSTRGVRVRAFPATPDFRGRLTCLFPKWDCLAGESFAAQYLLGVSMAAAADGFAVEPAAYQDSVALKSVVDRIVSKPPAGVVWANPAQMHIDHLARLKSAGIRLVTSIRYYPQIGVPYTRDDLAEAMPRLIAEYARRGIRRLGIAGMAENDPTYEPFLRLFVKTADAAGISVPPELTAHLKIPGIDHRSQEILTQELVRQIKPGDGLFVLGTDLLDPILNIARMQRRDLQQECVLGIHDIRALPFQGVPLVTECDVREHGARAVKLIVQWLQSGVQPEHDNVTMRIQC